MRNYLKLIIAGLISAALVSCGGGGSCSNCTPTPSPTGAVSLKFTAPTGYPAGVAIVMPVVIVNAGSSSIDLTKYSLEITDSTAGSGITVDNASVTACGVIASNSTCTIQVNLPATTVAGSFTIKGTAISSLSARLANDVKTLFTSKLANSSSSISAKATIGLVEVPANIAAGASGLTLYYPSSVVSNTSGDTYVNITAIVSSANAGVFNTLDLVDSSDNKLSNVTVLTGNSGSGLTSLSQYSVVSLLVKVPSRATQLQFKSRLLQNATIVDTGSNINTIQVLSASSEIGIANLSPNYFTLTSSSSTKELTLNNSGTGSLTNITISSSDQFSTTNTCNGSLTASTSCTITVTFKDSEKVKPIKGIGVIMVNYNTDATVTGSSTATINYEGTNATAGLSVISGSNPNFDFSTTTATPTDSTIVTVTNTGNNVESNIHFTTDYSSIGFSLSTSGVTNACTGTPFSLNVGESCNFVLTYTRDTALSQTSANLTFSYNYLATSGVTETSSDTFAVTYETLQSRAILVLDPSSNAFGTILNNGAASIAQRFVVINTGELPTTIASVLNVSGDFSVLLTDCNFPLNPRGSCFVDVKFGPVSSTVSPGGKTGTLTVSSADLIGAVSTTASLTGQVASAGTAILSMTKVESSGFSGGDGLSVTPYQIESGNAIHPTIAYTFKNTGEVSANNLYLSGTVSGWNIDSNTCGDSLNKVNLASNATCVVTFKLSTSSISSVGAHNLDLSSEVLNWIDEDSPTGQTQVLSGVQYVNVYAPAKITFNKESATVAPGESTTFTATLTGGYNVADNTISVTPSPANPDITVTSTVNGVTAPCTLNATTATCNFTVATTASITVGTSGLSVTSIGITPNYATLSLKVEPIAATKIIFISNAGTNGAIGGLTGADAFCQSAANSGSQTSSLGATWKALLRGNNATTIGTNYVTTMNETIAKATTTNLIAVNATNNTLVNAINKNENGDLVSQLAWTGGKGTTANTDNCVNWTSAQSIRSGSYGSSSSKTIWWNYVAYGTTYTNFCDQVQSLYCVQQ